jgi:hypothetical protein
MWADGCLPAGTPPGLALDAPGAEVALVDLDRPTERPLEFARLGHALAQAGEQTVDRVAVEAGEPGDLHGREVGGHMPQETAENAFTDPGAFDIAVLHRKYSLFGGC